MYSGKKIFPQCVCTVVVHNCQTETSNQIQTPTHNFFTKNQKQKKEKKVQTITEKKNHKTKEF